MVTSQHTIYIGIDLGTTVLKAAAFRASDGKLLAQTQQRLPIHSAADGTREQAPPKLDRALGSVCRGLRTALGKRWQQVAGIGLASQGGSSCICDRHTGRPFTPMRLWNDQRPSHRLPGVAAKKPVRYWRQLAMVDAPGMGLARMLWLRDRSPKLFRPDNIYVGAGEYVFFRLTGQWRQDPGNALQIGCFHVRRRALDPEPLRLVNVPLSFVAPLREGHSTVPLAAATAKRFGLPHGLPVAGPYIDHEAGYLSAVGISRRPLQCSLGTAWVGNFILPETARWQSPFQLVVPALNGPGWLIIQPLLTGNVTWDWALETFVDRDHRKALRQAATIFQKQLLPPAGLVALPWVNLVNPLKAGAMGAGGFFGVSPSTTPADLLRAVAVSMSFEMARLFQQVRDRKRADSVVLGGGASKGRYFQVLMSALFAPLPVYRMKEEDLSGPRGAVYAFNRKAAAGKSVRVPRPPKAVCQRIAEGYKVYEEVFRRMYGHGNRARALEFQ